MRKVSLLRKRFTLLIAGMQFLAGGMTFCQDRAAGNGSCRNWELLSSHPLSALPSSVQSELRQAVRVPVQKIMNDPGMGVSETQFEQVSLNALQVASMDRVLYVVAWDESVFGVNGFNWIVEVNAAGATNLSTAKGTAYTGGFGVKVIGAGIAGYPDLMFASKSYGPSVAEAQAICFRKPGLLYEAATCPATCQDELNAQDPSQ